VAVSASLGGIVKRREDPRLVTGTGRFTDDVRLDGCLHAVFVRSTMAHARITGVDIQAAAHVPGVAGIFLARDLQLKPQEFPSLDLMARPPLAAEVVRFVGDAIAVVVAETPGQATDAAAAVVVDYSPLALPSFMRPRGTTSRRRSCLAPTTTPSPAPRWWCAAGS